MNNTNMKIVVVNSKVIEVNDKFFKKILSYVKKEFCRDEWMNSDFTLNIDGVIECFMQNWNYILPIIYKYGDAYVNEIEYDEFPEYTNLRNAFKDYLLNLSKK